MIWYWSVLRGGSHYHCCCLILVARLLHCTMQGSMVTSPTCDVGHPDLQSLDLWPSRRQPKHSLSDNTAVFLSSSVKVRNLGNVGIMWPFALQVLYVLSLLDDWLIGLDDWVCDWLGCARYFVSVFSHLAVTFCLVSMWMLLFVDSSLGWNQRTISNFRLLLYEFCKSSERWEGSLFSHHLDTILAHWLFKNSRSFPSRFFSWSSLRIWSLGLASFANEHYVRKSKSLCKPTSSLPGNFIYFSNLTLNAFAMMNWSPCLSSRSFLASL